MKQYAYVVIEVVFSKEHAGFFESASVEKVFVGDGADGRAYEYTKEMNDLHGESSIHVFQCQEIE